MFFRKSTNRAYFFSRSKLKLKQLVSKHKSFANKFITALLPHKEAHIDSKRQFKVFIAPSSLRFKLMSSRSCLFLPSIINSQKFVSLSQVNARESHPVWFKNQAKKSFSTYRNYNLFKKQSRNISLTSLNLLWRLLCLKSSQKAFNNFSLSKLANIQNHNINLNYFKSLKLVMSSHNIIVLKVCVINLFFNQNYAPLCSHLVHLPGYLLVTNSTTNTVYKINLKKVNVIFFPIVAANNLVRGVKTFRLSYKKLMISYSIHNIQLFQKPIRPLRHLAKKFSDNKSAMILPKAQTLNYLMQLKTLSYLSHKSLINLKMLKLLQNAALAVNHQINRRLLNSEYKIFLWKLKAKHNYHQQSRWKQSAAFKSLFLKAEKNYRKINKNYLFVKLFKVTIHQMLGLSNVELQKFWLKARRGFGHSFSASSLHYLSTILAFKLDNLALLLGLRQNKYTAVELVKAGFFKVNGLVVSNANFTIFLFDVLQLNLDKVQASSLLNLSSIRHNTNFMPFFQSLWSIASFVLVRYPYNFELISESTITDRWLRFYLRYCSIKAANIKSIKH